MGFLKNHLTKVIHQLSKLKVVDSARGKKRWHSLSNAPQKTSMLATSFAKQSQIFFVVACFADEPAQDDLMTDNLMTNDLRKIKTLDLSVGQPAMSCVISPACHLKQVFCRSRQGIFAGFGQLYAGGHHQQRR